MPFQNSVNMYPAAGVAGDQAGLNPVAYLLPVPVAGEGGVITGRACWYDPDNIPGRVLNSTEGTTTGEGEQAVTTYEAPLGIAQRVMTGVIPCNEGATVTILEGHSVAVVTRGDLLVTSAAAVTAGQKVFASVTDGSLTGAAAGATVEGSVETGWTIRESAAAGDIFHISNW